MVGSGKTQVSHSIWFDGQQVPDDISDQVEADLSSTSVNDKDFRDDHVANMP